MTLESLNTILELASAILLGLTFAVGACAIWTNHVLNKRQEETIAVIQRDTAAASERVEKAQQGLAEANERAANAEKGAAEASRKADEERIARLKLEAQMAPRRISGEQERLMRTILERNPAQINFFVETGTPEVADFASDLQRAFTNSGWTVSVNPGIAFGGTARGLALRVGQNRTAQADIIAEALHAASLVEGPLPATQVPDPNLLQLTILPK